MLQKRQCCFRVVDEVHEFHVFGADHAMRHQCLEIDHFLPEARAVEQDGKSPIDLARLLEGEQFATLSAIAAGGPLPCPPAITTRSAKPRAL